MRKMGDIEQHGRELERAKVDTAPIFAGEEINQ